jgi:hypothetical protein
MKPSFWLLGALLMAVALLKLPSLFFAHQGVDELVYVQLAGNWLQTGKYSLQGTEILAALPAMVYDRPLFHHPPLYAALLSGFLGFGFEKGAVLISWAGHLLALTGVFLEWRRNRSQSQEPSPDWPWFLAMGALAFDPLLIFVGRKIWMDSLLAGFLTLAVACFLRFLSQPRVGWILGCGVLVGLSGLLKLHALSALAFFGIGLWVGLGAVRIRALAQLIAGPALLVGPWILWFHHVYGVWSPGWVLEGASLGDKSEFMAAALHTPPSAYWTRLLGINPALICSGVWACFARTGSGGRAGGIDGARWLAAFGLFWLLTMTALAGLGTTCEMRYLVPALPAWYAVVALRLRNQTGYTMFAVLSFLFAAAQGGIYLVSGLHDEFSGFWQLSGGR